MSNTEHPDGTTNPCQTNQTPPAADTSATGTQPNTSASVNAPFSGQPARAGSPRTKSAGRPSGSISESLSSSSSDPFSPTPSRRTKAAARSSLRPSSTLYAALAVGAILIGGGYSLGSYAATSGPAAPEAAVSTSGPAEVTTSATPAPDAPSAPSAPPHAPADAPAHTSQRDLSGEVAANLGYQNLRAACNHGWRFACLIIRVEHTAPGTMTAHVSDYGDDIAELLAKNAPAGIDTIVTVEPDGETHTETARPGEVTA